MDAVLEFLASLLASEQFATFLIAWATVAVVLAVALFLRRLRMRMAELEEAKRQARIEARIRAAERREAERALKAVESGAVKARAPRRAEDFTPYGYADRVA